MFQHHLWPLAGLVALTLAACPAAQQKDTPPPTAADSAAGPTDAPPRRSSRPTCADRQPPAATTRSVASRPRRPVAPATSPACASPGRAAADGTARACAVAMVNATATPVQRRRVVLQCSMTAPARKLLRPRRRVATAARSLAPEGPATPPPPDRAHPVEDGRKRRAPAPPEQGARRLPGASHATSHGSDSADATCGDGGVYTFVPVYRDWLASASGGNYVAAGGGDPGTVPPDDNTSELDDAGDDGGCGATGGGGTPALAGLAMALAWLARRRRTGARLTSGTRGARS